MTLPDDLPAPVDDGACDHLPGHVVEPLILAGTDGRAHVLASILPRRLVVYAYPRTGVPGEPSLLDDWDSIPGARGCTPETCGFRDHHRDLAALGADVFGVSTQATSYQQEAAARLELPFPLLSDLALELTRSLNLPNFTAAGEVLIKRLTMIITGNRIEHVFYPVFPPDQHAEEVVAWLEANPV
ncbi:peroxiredoxin [soil metagenome]